MKELKLFLKATLSSLRDLLPIIIVITLFQVLIIKQTPPNVMSIMLGLFFVVLGLTFFIYGLEKALFPIGETIAYSLAKKGSLFWLLFFAFTLGFGTTIAEPALTAVAHEAATIAAESELIASTDAAKDKYAFGLRLSVAVSVGFAITLGIIRILKNWSIIYIIVTGYAIVLVTTLFAPKFIIGVAYDSGGVTTSTITVPLVTALGIGLSSSISGRNPMLDGFGLIALASLFPMIFVMFYGIIIT